MKQYKRFGFNAIFPVLLLALSCLSRPSWAAPCCARNSATPMLIVGDDEAQINVGTALANAVADTAADGIPIFHSPNTSDVSQTFRLDGAVLISDRLQLGTSISVMNHSVSDFGVTDSTFALGDARLSVGYEALPAWSYSEWKPQIFLFSLVTFPTGRSKFESQKPTSSDVTGNGFYAVSVGSLVVKRWALWDMFLVPEIHYAIPRTFQTSSGSLSSMPGFGGSFGLGVGVSPGGGDLRLGVRVQPRLDQAATTTNAGITSFGAGMLSVCDTGLDASYLFNTTDTLMVSYTDQTLLGVATNLPLTRSLAINFQHRWER